MIMLNAFEIQLYRGAVVRVLGLTVDLLYEIDFTIELSKNNTTLLTKYIVS